MQNSNWWNKRGAEQTSIKNNLWSTQVSLLGLFYVPLLPLMINFKTTMELCPARLQHLNVYQQTAILYQLLYNTSSTHHLHWSG